MKITVLGSGGFFTLNNWHANFLVEVEDYRLLIDCGSDCRHALNRQGYSYKDIHGVFISHLHGDHAGGMEWLGFAKYFDPTQNTPNLYISESLVQPLWNNTLSGGMGSLQGKITTLSDYFYVNPIEKNGDFKIGGVVFRLVQTVHVMNGYYIVPSFGLLVSDGKTNIFMTGDTQYAPEQINHFYKISGLIFHDCELLYLPDGKPIFSTVHAHYDKLKSLPKSVKKKMWLNHYQDNIPSFINAPKDGFIGFLTPGRTFEF